MTDLPHQSCVRTVKEDAVPNGCQPKMLERLLFELRRDDNALFRCDLPGSVQTKSGKEVAPGLAEQRQCASSCGWLEFGGFKFLHCTTGRSDTGRCQQGRLSRSATSG